MRLNKIRRAQLIAPFGPGSIHILKNGLSVVTAGLDHWFKSEDGVSAEESQIAKLSEKVVESRLARILHVSHFRAAPSSDHEEGEPKLVVPVLRFPTWHVCPRCKRMEREKLHREGWIKCKQRECNQNGERLIQLRFAAVCDHGHLQDFPWNEWVHRSRSPNCLGSKLRYEAKGSSALSDIVIHCDDCHKKRNLNGIMSGAFGDPNDPESSQFSVLTKQLLPGDDLFLCQGKKVWLGEDCNDDCSRHLRAILINATNAHYSNVRSAIYLPQFFATDEMNRLHSVLKEPWARSRIRLKKLVDPDSTNEAIAENLRHHNSEVLEDYSDNDIAHTVGKILGNERIEIDSATTSEDEALPDYEDSSIRIDEYPCFTQMTGDFDGSAELIVRRIENPGISNLSEFINLISLVDKLRETRVFTGFSRLLHEIPEGAPNPQRMLWRDFPNGSHNRWLPATAVQGEGIFIRFNETRLRSWEKEPSVVNRVMAIQQNYDEAHRRYGWTPKLITPRFMMIHTFAHLIINELVFECGYGSASLRERLYVSENEEHPMAGVLIYTASGDSDGGMGGLARMGEPDNLEKVISKALERARWCSADPVCSESYQTGGQGPDSLNLAACHNCALLPETSCEEFNRFLDRCLLVGDQEESHVGLFEEIFTD